VPKLNFDGNDKNDIIENLERGSGPGGQSVAKSSNAVILKHTPTGILVKCHQTRSVETNRKIAQEKLVDALDKFTNGEDSVDSQAQVFVWQGIGWRG
jgi:protein subunit release factor B